MCNINNPQKKIIFIGPVNQGKPADCGATMKNQLLIERFQSLFKRVIVVDTYRWNKKPFILIKVLISLIFFTKANVVISSNSDSAYRLIKFLYFFKLKKNLFYWVIGGSLHNKIKTKRFNAKYYKFLKRIIVEGRVMEKELKKCGLSNVLIVPNFKPVIYKPIHPNRVKGPIRFVFLSRILISKGVEYIIESAKQLNNCGFESKFTVDFYGKMSDDYDEIFKGQIESIPNLNYQGLLNFQNSDGYVTLSTYNIMLFPTFWEGEGFPGVVIDAYIAGLPVIASDWNLNRNVIENEKSGIIIPVHDTMALTNAMKAIIEGQIDIGKMSKYCLELASMYDIKTVLSEELFTKLRLIQ